jgi:hypothetical protein
MLAWLQRHPDRRSAVRRRASHGTTELRVHRSLAIVMFAAVACGSDRHSSELPPESGPEIVIDSQVAHQTITGWEATLQAGQEHPSYPAIRDTLLGLAVRDLGINRVRIDVRSGMENTRDWYGEFRAGRIDMTQWRCQRYAPVNDNDDARVPRDGGFFFSELDVRVEDVLLPMRALLRERGDSLLVNLAFVAFSEQTCTPSLLVHDDPEEYAEFVLAVVQHLDGKYGVVPDRWEVILEPDNTSFWRGKQIGEAIVAAARRLAEHGYERISFVAPSNTNMTRAVRYFDDMARVPGALEHLSELSYHRYGGVSRDALEDLANRAQAHGLGTAMLEHIGSGYEDLHADLALGRASAWQQFALAFPLDDDNGAQYYRIDVSDPAAPRVVPGSRTPYLRQYFHYVRPGAQRIGAASRVAALDPLAFVNRDGRWVVVVKCDRPASFRIGGLPEGRYGVSHTTEAGSVEVSPVPVTANDIARLTIPGAGVLTLHQL